MNELISVIVPIYNTDKFLERCINSIIKQSYKNIEILLINDGSTDNSFKICMEFQKKDKRIKVFSKQHQGVSATRNLGITNSKGKYICFIDSDDWIEENSIEILKNGIKNRNLSACEYRVLNGSEHKIAHKIEKDIILKPKEFLNILFYNENYKLLYQGVVYNKLFEKNIIDRYNIRFDEDIQYNEDRLFILKYILKINNNILISNYIGYNYYKRENSLTNQKEYTKNMYTEFIAFDRMSKLVLKERLYDVDDLIRIEYVSRLLSMVFRFYSKNNEDMRQYISNVKKYLNQIIKSKQIRAKSKLSILKKYIMIHIKVIKRKMKK